MQRFLLCIALLGSAILLSDDEYSPEEYPSFEDQKQIVYNAPDFSYIPSNNNGNDNFSYHRIGRFSDEDCFDVSCVKDVIACAPNAVKQIIVNLLYPPKNRAALPKRLLLVGKPGTGKTTLAKAIAYRCGYDYYVIEAPFLLNEYKNSGPQNLLREIYPLLSSGRPVVVILDELTELTDRYKKENDSDASVAAALWILLDSCAQFDNVFFIGTSNKNKKDLPAQLQSRFDEDIITIHMPHAAARKRILQRYLKDERHKVDNDFLQYLVKKTDGRSVREIEKLVFKAIQFANVRTPRRYTVMPIDFTRALKLWKPFWHPTVVYQTLEPHIQPFFKTALPIILQAIGLAHNIYAAERQNISTQRGLALQEASYLLQESAQAIQQKWHVEATNHQDKAFEHQKHSHKESFDHQEKVFDHQKHSHKESFDHQEKVFEYNKNTHNESVKEQKNRDEKHQNNHEDSMKQNREFHNDSMEQQKNASWWNKAGMGVQVGTSLISLIPLLLGGGK